MNFFPLIQRPTPVYSLGYCELTKESLYRVKWFGKDKRGWNEELFF